MKSVKLILMAVVCLAVSVHAENPQRPWWYDARRIVGNEAESICEMPVYIDLPGYAVILSKDDLRINLFEVDVETYKGCTDFRMLSLIDVTLGCRVVNHRKVPGEFSCTLDNRYVDVTGKTPVKRQVCVKLENCNLFQVHAYQNNLQVATVTLTVAPRL